LPKDRDFVETVEGWFFCLVGYLHPPDRYTAYLKYTPAEAGRWARGNVFYRRELPYYHVRNAMSAVELLERTQPRYVWFDPIQGLRFSFVPRDAIARYYIPERRLAELRRAPADALEADAVAATAILAERAGLSDECFGIGGSILLSLHNPAFSDIDVLVYGRDNALRVKHMLSGSLPAPLADLEPERRARWRTEIADRFSLTPAAIAALEARRWNYFLYRDRYVSVHPTRRDGEIREVYGARRYRPIGAATVEGIVADASESGFLPAVYALVNASFADGRALPAMEVVSYEGLFCDAADAGDRVRATGLLEEIAGAGFRLVVGTGAVPDGGALWRVDRG
jgi:hypothetical protein